MKRTERHHLKENELVLSVNRARETFEVYRKPIIAAAVALVVLIVAVLAFVYWRREVGDRSRTLFGEAMAIEQSPVLPPVADGQKPAVQPPGSYPTDRARLEAALAKYLAVAEADPSSAAGIAGRYHAAAILAQLGRNRDAATRYQEVLDRGGSKSIFREVAKLGLADAEAASGQYDKAIGIYQELAGASASALPTDGILLQLARAQAAKGSTADARRAYQRVADEFPESPFAATAKRELEALK